MNAKAMIIAVAVLIALALTSYFWPKALSWTPTALTFKDDLPTTVIPKLLTGLLVIAAISERAVAVINDIWFGEEREKRQEAVRAKAKELDMAIQDDKVVRDTQAKVAIATATANPEAAITAQAMADLVASTATVPDTRVPDLHAQLATENQNLATVDAKADRTRLYIGFVVGLFVSFAGVRVLDSLLSGHPTGGQPAFFQFVDIVLTAGVLAGGTTAINAISDLLGIYANTSRKKALEAG